VGGEPVAAGVRVTAHERLTQRRALDAGLLARVVIKGVVEFKAAPVSGILRTLG
jgi:hypothetical protein